jgi:hypothetical protein
LIAHRFWEFEGPARQMQQTQFFKNVAIIGGFFALWTAGAGRYAIDRLWHRERFERRTRERRNGDPVGPRRDFLAADPDVAAGGAVVAAVLADERGVAALGALRAGHDRDVLLRGRGEDAHLAPRHAELVEDAEHDEAVQDERAMYEMVDGKVCCFLQPGRTP